jgi:site-specific DNA recombinase
MIKISTNSTNNKTESKRVALYCRVSTYDQSKGDFSSLDNQELILKEYCQARHWSITRVFRDASTGSNLDRPELKKLIRDIERKKNDIVLITKLDRISRNPKDLYNLDEIFSEHEVDLISTSQDIDTRTPQGKFFRDLLMLFARFERELIAERTFEKNYNQARQGRWSGGPPLGYDLVEKKLVVNKEEKEIVNKIFDYYLEDKSTASVAKRLTDEGYCQKRGGLFRKNSIPAQLSNPVYVGKIKFNDELFDGLHVPIVDIDKFNKVKELFKQAHAKKKPAYKSKHELLLLGILKCGFCGSAMTTSYTKKKNGHIYFYYKCSKQHHFAAGICPQRPVESRTFEKAITTFLFELSQDKKLIDSTIKMVESGSIQELKNFKEDIKKKDSRIASFKKQELSLLSAIKSSPKLKDLESISNDLHRIEESIKNLSMQKNQIKKEIDILTEQNLDKDVLIKIYSDFTNLFDKFNFEEKQTAIRLLLREIEVTIHKDHPADAKIKMALWNHTSTEPILLSELNSSSLRRTKLRR